MHKLGRLAVAAFLLIVASGVLAGCGRSAGSEDAAHGSDITATPLKGRPSAAGKVIEVTLHDGAVHPSGARVKVNAGDPVTLVIDADAAGELHVHSTPEKHIEFGKGRSSATLELDEPGVVDVEDHALDKLIVQLEVR